MYKLEFILKQHTPLIHFQHYQDGATLRATEVKPKLDRFIIEKSFPDKFEECKIFLVGFNPQKPNELKEKFGKGFRALDYKLKIEAEEEWIHYIEEPKYLDDGITFLQNNQNPEKTETKPYPMYFGNMGNNFNNCDEIKKFLYTTKEIKVNFSTSHISLRNLIEKHITNFFCHYNFGSRQNKGFGSYFLTDTLRYPLDEKQFDYKFNFTINEDTVNTSEFFREIFGKINWFYCALRGGLNVKSFLKKNGERVKDADGQFIMRDDFYFKSLLFLYFKNLTPSIQWEKKTIKENFFPITKRFPDKKLKYTGLNDQQKLRTIQNENPLYFVSKNKLLIRDLFGLSTDEQWQSYKDVIKKTDAKKDAYGNWTSKAKDDETIIQRYASPILFKPIILENICTIYIRLDNVGLLGKDFMIENKNGTPFHLSTPANFDIKLFFDFIKNPVNFDINKHVENINGFHDRPEFKFLKRAFLNLTKI